LFTPDSKLKHAQTLADRTKPGLSFQH